MTVFLSFMARNDANALFERKSAQEFIVYESSVRVMSNSVKPKYVVPTTLTESSDTALETIIPESSLLPAFSTKSNLLSTAEPETSDTDISSVPPATDSEICRPGRQEVNVNATLAYIKDLSRYRLIELFI